MSANPKIRDWQGRRVWLVGASTGIGAALALALARRGARLALSARSRDRLAALGIDGALLLPCDATDAQALAAARDELLKTWGGVDVVVYLAGDYRPMSVDQFDLATAEAVVEVNFNGAMRLAASVLKDLTPGGGIAFVASVAGYRGLPRALCYGPGKAALIHFAEILHLDLAPRGIGVWLINPGFVATRLTARNDFAMPAMLSADQAAQACLDGLAEGRFEIHFPKRFTALMKLLALLPYRLYFPLIRRTTGSGEAQPATATATTTTTPALAVAPAPIAVERADDIGNRDPLAAVAGFYASFTPASIARLGEFYQADASFKDPFNEVRGIAPIQRIFSHMYQQVDAPRFVVTERLGDANGGVLVWEFRFRFRRGDRATPQVMRGASHLRFAANGKVTMHRDYWDTGEELYQKLPLLGPPMRWLRRRLSASA